MKTRRKKSLLLTVILAIVMTLALTFSAYAAQSDAVSKDGLTAQLFTDKDAYAANESVVVTVRVDNQIGKEVSIVTTINVPESAKLANESATYEAALKAGETWTTPEVESEEGTIGSDAETEDATTGSDAETDSGAAGGDVETGDNMKAGLWIIMAVISVGTIIALLVVGKNRKTWITMILCLTMVGGLATATISSQAADVSDEIQLSCTISVDGKEETVSATVAYVIHIEESTEEATEPSTEATEPSTEATEPSTEATEPDEEPTEPDEEPTEPSDRLKALLAQAEVALTYGRNFEGALYPKLFVNGINPETMGAPIWVSGDNTKHYVSNLYGQTNFLKMLEGLTKITGVEKYEEAAYDQIKVRYDTPGLVDSNGLIYAGGHTITDVMTGKQYTNEYETKDDRLPVEMLYKADPDAFERFVTAVWNAHVINPSNLEMNRHGEYNAELRDLWNVEYTDPSPWIVSSASPFLTTANDMIELAYYLSYYTGDPIYQTWGERLLDKFIAVTDEDTGLTGGVYGRKEKTDMEGWSDRWLYNFHGADFVDAKGVDYKTLTEDDYKICGETMELNRNTLKATMGYGPQVYIKLYEMTGQQKLYDFVKGNMLGLVRYVYDPEIHRLKTPMSTNGTDFNPGGDGPVLVAPRTYYYKAEGQSFAENESVFGLMLRSLIDTAHMLKDEDAAEREELWAAARAWAKNEGLGDIGTAMGENVNVNLETTSVNTHYVTAVLSLYKHTRHQQYYDLAVKMADNILEKYFNEETGLFTTDADAPYVKFDTEQMYVVFLVEAMTQGLIDEVNLDLAHEGAEVGNVGEGDLFYSRDKVNVEKVDLGAETYSLFLEKNNLVIADVSGHTYESAIRQMAALGVMDVDTDGKFAPDAAVTRADLVQMVVELFSFDNAEGLIDENLGGAAFDGDKIATREEMASIVVRALKKATPEKTYNVADSLYRLEDAGSIADWARDYADIATSYRLMVDITEDVFAPKAEVTKAMAAYTFRNLCGYIDLKGVQSLTATVTPANADSAVITWATSDNTVVEVDQQGRLYPLKTGEAVITATADGVSAQIKVTIVKPEDWMIKEILIDGQKLERFDANIKEYQVELAFGTTGIPTIEAVSFNGQPVDVKMPETLPGKVELTVKDSEVTYTIQLSAAQTLIYFDDDFNSEYFPVGSKIYSLGVSYSKLHRQIEDEYVLGISKGISGFSSYYRDRSTIVNPIAGDTANKCILLDYDSAENAADSGVKVNVFDLSSVPVGSAEDTNFLVFEFEIMTTGTANLSFNITHRSLEPVLTSGISNGKWVLEDSTGRMVATDQDYEAGRFNHIKIVIEKRTLTADYYINGTLLNTEASQIGYPSLESLVEIDKACVRGLRIDIPKETLADIKLYIDNVKFYEIMAKDYEDPFGDASDDGNGEGTGEGEGSGEGTGEGEGSGEGEGTGSGNGNGEGSGDAPEAGNHIVNESYDSYAKDTVLSATINNNSPYSWVFTNSGENYAKVVPKTEVSNTADASDMCILLPGNASAKVGYYLRLNEAFSLASGAGTDKLAIEMDVACVDAAYNINFTDQDVVLGSVLKSTAVDETYTWIVSSKLKYPCSMTDGTFAKLKVVIDQSTQKWSAYWNGTLMTSYKSGTTEFGAICITETDSTGSAKLYIDNIKIYKMETTE